MANRAEAYDFSLFEDKNAAVVFEPQIEERPQRRENVVELPEREPEKQPEAQKRPKRSLLKMAAATLSFLLVFAVSISAVQSEVQLTEITDEINKVRTELAEAESLEIQLTMQAAQQMTDAQVEAYAVEQLGMGKITGSQVVYLHVAQQDKGTVVQEVGGESWLDRILAALREWIS